MTSQVYHMIPTDTSKPKPRKFKNRCQGCGHDIRAFVVRRGKVIQMPEHCMSCLIRMKNAFTA